MVGGRFSIPGRDKDLKECAFLGEQSSGYRENYYGVSWMEIWHIREDTNIFNIMMFI